MQNHLKNGDFHNAVIGRINSDWPVIMLAPPPLFPLMHSVLSLVRMLSFPEYTRPWDDYMLPHMLFLKFEILFLFFFFNQKIPMHTSEFKCHLFRKIF